MSTSIPGNSDSQSSFSWSRRLAIVACLIVGSVFSSRAMTPDAAAKVTSETSQQAEHQGSVELTAPADADVKLVTKNIEDIQAGDLVLARDEHGSGIGLKPVKETYQRVSHHLRHLTFKAPDGNQQTLSTTDEHPFWSVTADDFVEAGALIVGHSVTGPNGETQTLVNSNREEFPEGVRVFNFQVTDYHTYFVAASADKPVMLVHNADHAYRVMSAEEIAKVRSGAGWTDPKISETPGVKQLWTNEAAARRWQEYLQSNGEVGEIVKVRLFDDASSFPQWTHRTPSGRVVEVPLDQLGEIIEILR